MFRKNIMNFNTGKMIILLFINTLLIISLFTACTKNDEIQKNNITNSNKDKISEFSDFFMSSEGENFLFTTWQFIKAYFSSDAATMEKYLLEGIDAESYGKDVFNDIEYINLQWNLSNINSENEISLTYIFQIKDDSLTYLDLDLQKNNNEWKVSFYTLEK